MMFKQEPLNKTIGLQQKKIFDGNCMPCNHRVTKFFQADYSLIMSMFIKTFFNGDREKEIAD